MFKGIVTLGNLPCNLSCNFVEPLQHKLYERLHSVTSPVMNIPRNVLLQQPLHEVQPTPTFCNSCANKKIARHVKFMASMLHLATIRATCVTKKLRDKLSCKKNCLAYR